MKYKQELSRQLALDYCCNVEDILDNKNHFNVYEQRDGRRRFEEQDDCVLKVIVVNEKLIFTGKKEIVNICKEKYETCSGVWFMDVARFRELDTILKPYGYQLKTAHPFFLPEKSENRRSDGQKSACQDALSGKENRAFEIKKYNHDEIQQFKGNEQFNEAFCFDENSPDMLAVAAISKRKIIGMAGASADSTTFWQIGINTEKEAEGRGIASLLVKILKEDIEKLGKVPYYGTSMSNLVSQRVAANAGFKPAWVELLAERI